MLPPETASSIRIDALGPRQIALLITGTVVLFADGFDGQVVSFVAPALAAAWHLTHAQLGYIFAANLFGLMIGAMAVTPLADMFSRRFVTILCVGAFGVLTLCAPFTHNALQLGELRLITGLTLGGAMPSMIVAVSEFLPARLRARLLGVLICGFSSGFAAAGLAAAALLKSFGWTALFTLGGVMPLLLVPLLLAFLPESPAYLIAQHRLDDLQAVLRRMGARLTWPGGTAAPHVGFPLFALFRNGLAPITLGVWITYFCSGTTLYFMGQWLPLLLTGAGYGQSQALLVSTVYQFGGIAGGILVGVLVDRRGMPALVAAIGAASLAVVATGLAAASLPLLVALVGLAGICVVGGQNGLNAYVGSFLYPGAFRVTGLGWGIGVTRLAGVLASSLAAGYVLGLHLPNALTFLIFGIPDLLGAATLLWVSRRHTASPTRNPGRS